MKEGCLNIRETASTKTQNCINSPRLDIEVLLSNAIMRVIRADLAEICTP